MMAMISSDCVLATVLETFGCLDTIRYLSTWSSGMGWSLFIVNNRRDIPNPLEQENFDEGKTFHALHTNWRDSNQICVSIYIDNGSRYSSFVT
jgi:hypothetical protein